MKLNSQSSFFIVFVILCIIFDVSAAVPTRSVLEPEIRGQINDCERDCQTYRGSLLNFLISMKLSDWEIAKKDFSTCQWRCHRCTLQYAIYGMEYIEDHKEDFVGDAVNLKGQQHIIIPAVNACVRQWEAAALFGCDKNPVESYTRACVLD